MAYPGNQQICQVFEQLRDLRTAQGETYRARAYEKVIPVIRSYPVPITSAEQALAIPGIGKSLAPKIEEILRTGTVAELAQSTSPLGTIDQDREQVIQEFIKIERVGRKTAERWYDAGYRKLGDIPREVCTDAQWVGIQLYGDLSQRIPRDEIDETLQRLTQCLAPYGIQFEIAGSYRRGRPDSGDIDILVIDKPGMDVMSTVLSCGIFTHKLAQGPKKFLGIGKIRDKFRRIDIELVQPEEYAFAITYFTGSQSFNIKMRDHVSQMGYRLNEKSLTDPSGNKYPAKTEQQLFTMVGLQYLTPQERDKY